MALALCLGCASGDVDRSADETEDELGNIAKLVGGRFTFERPEVGKTQIGCTGTLIRPNVVLTAAHCIDYQSQEGNRPIESFTIEFSAQNSRTFPVNAYASFSREPGASDVALMRLSEAVPADVATPRAIAASAPPHGTSVTAFGYGCQSDDRMGDAATGRKQKVTYVLSAEDTRHLCPGDSGGPQIREDEGTIFLVNSAIDPNREWADIFADPVLNRDALNALADRWAAGANNALPEQRDPNARDLSCNAVLDCLAACQDDACRQQCISRASGEATLFYDALAACFTQAQCADWACVEMQCAPQLTACRNDTDSGGSGAPFPAPPEGQNDCNTLLNCYSGCNDNQCVNVCRREATNAANGELDGLLACVEQHQCQDYACMVQHCSAQYTTCTGMAPPQQPEPPPQQQPDPPQQPPQGGQLSCNDLINCSWQCADQACFAQCQAQASPQANQAYTAYANCFFNNNCQDEACAAQFCSAEYTACTGQQLDPPQQQPPQQQPPQQQPPGNTTCEGIDQCMQACPAGNQGCYDQCYAGGSQAAQASYLNLSNCAIRNQCQDGNCVAARCAGEYQACFGRPPPPQQGPPPQQQPPGGGQSCPEVLDCFGRCPDQACIQTCFDAGSDAAQQQVNGIYDCIDFFGCQDQTCVQQNCQAAVNACQ